jgi:CheY-like chemotaxis protein
MPDARSLLLVEDSSSDVELALSALEIHGLARRIAVARDVDAALDFLSRHSGQAGRPSLLPAAVLVDLKLPRAGGLQLLATLKADPRFRLIPVIMLTSSREGEDVRRSYELGAAAYVVKPVDFAEFAEALRRVVLFWCELNEAPPGTLPRPARGAPA